VGVRLLAARGGRLYLKGSVLVVTALEVVANGERFWFQIPSKKTVWTGSAAAPPEAEGSDQAPYYALRPGDISAAFLPEPLAPAAGEVVVMESLPRAFSLTVARPREGRALARRQVTLERASLLPERSRAYDERGELSSEVSYGAWSGGVPRRLVVSRPAQGYRASFSLEKAQANVPVPERAFEPRTPAGYRLERVGEP
jgi:hypothetical protein